MRGKKEISRQPENVKNFFAQKYFDKVVDKKMSLNLIFKIVRIFHLFEYVRDVVYGGTTGAVLCCEVVR